MSLLVEFTFSYFREEGREEVVGGERSIKKAGERESKGAKCWQLLALDEGHIAVYTTIFAKFQTSLLYRLSVGLKFCNVKLGGIKKSPWQA